MPILGRMMLDPQRYGAPLDLLLQNKLEHHPMLSLGLSFSPFPAGDPLSRQGQKTKYRNGKISYLKVRVFHPNRHPMENLTVRMEKAHQKELITKISA